MIRNLKNGTTTVIDQTNILQEIETFYSKLYTRTETDNPEEWIQELQENTQIPKINDENIEQLLEDLTKEKLASIVKKAAQRIKPQEMMGCPPNFMWFSGRSYQTF